MTDLARLGFSAREEGKEGNKGRDGWSTVRHDGWIKGKGWHMPSQLVIGRSRWGVKKRPEGHMVLALLYPPLYPKGLELKKERTGGLSKRKSIRRKLRGLSGRALESHRHHKGH